MKSGYLHDFVNVVTRLTNKDVCFQQEWNVSLDYEDLSVRGGEFQAVWDPDSGIWRRDIRYLINLIDSHVAAMAAQSPTGTPLYLKNFSNRQYETMLRAFKTMRSCGPQDFDRRVVFAGSHTKREDCATKRVPYQLHNGETPAWDRLLDVLYAKDRTKIEWALGSIFDGYSRKLQKFFVFYGAPGTGKSTMLAIIEDLFQGYTSTINARELVSSNNAFATAALKNNPLVIMQHDADLSKVRTNSTLNAIVSHETIRVNEKYALEYDLTPVGLMFLGTNENVEIISSKSGLIRRLVDIHSTGHVLAADEYFALIEGVRSELGAIANRCLKVFRELGKHYYSEYQPTMMMYQSNDVYNFVAERLDLFREAERLPMKRIWAWYKEWCEETNTEKMNLKDLRTDLMPYFEGFEKRGVVEHDGEKIQTTSIFIRFKGLESNGHEKVTDGSLLDQYQMDLFHELGTHPSALDEAIANMPAQKAGEDGNPAKAWARVNTLLADIDTRSLHWVKLPENHIVIDFDLVDEDGNKSYHRNCKAASEWPPTYAETSKSGKGIHLHYLYEGDPEDLAVEYDVGIDIKHFKGNASLRRRLTLCNERDIAVLRKDLPRKTNKKKVNPMLDMTQVRSEKGLRELIERNLRKEIHGHVKPSMDFIRQILDESYEQGLSYDVSDMRSRILQFAMSSSNQADACVAMIPKLKLIGVNEMRQIEEDRNNAPIYFFDIEVYPNIVVVCYKKYGDPDDSVKALINPTPEQVEPLMSYKLVGFNNRHYDNHILYAIYQGFTVPEIYRLSQAIVVHKDASKKFSNAYNLSYADVYDFASKKQSLKRFEHDLKILHMEVAFPFDQPVDPADWDKLVAYCKNDVNATEAVFNDRHQDFVARQILAALSGLSVNDTTQQHAARIIFGANRNPQSSFVYTKLAEKFPGYSYDPMREPKSVYRDEDVGEGGYVYVEPGVYYDVAHLDVASMHPTSIELLNLFGPYTERFVELKNARLAIKHGGYDEARKAFDGKLAPFLEGAEDNPTGADQLAYALKIVINIVYGLTSAAFPNAFRDPRNVDNIVAKHGALFMINLKNEIQDLGFTVIHIKTDSIKIANATPEIIEFVMDYGRQWGYDFEHEATYDMIALVNAADYIAREFEEGNPRWTAVGAKFQHPYVFKTLFSHEELTLDDLTELKSVKDSAIYMDFHGAETEADMVHVGRTGVFVPVRYDGADLWRIAPGKKSAVTGTKGYKWVTRDMAEKRWLSDDMELFVDMDYFESLAREAIIEIETYGGEGAFGRLVGLVAV